MSAWQRLQAVGSSADDAKKEAERGLLLFGCESPFSWLMCISLGVLLVTIIPDLAIVGDKAGPLAVFSRMLLSSGSTIDVGITFLFMVAVMGIMLSTIDSALLAAMYAYTADIRHFPFKVVDRSDKAEYRNADSLCWQARGLHSGLSAL